MPVTQTHEMVRVGDIQKPAYQRDPEDRLPALRRHLREAGGYDPVLAGAITVCERPDGSYMGIDGLGRCWLATTVHGPNHLMPATVIRGLPDEATEQTYFENFHKRRVGIKATDIFLGKLSVGGSEQVAISAVLANHGLTVTRRAGPGGFQSVESAQRAWRLGTSTEMGSEALLDRALTIIHNGWGTAVRVDGIALLAVARVLRQSEFPPCNSSMDDDRLSSVLRGYAGPKQFLDASGDRLNGGHGHANHSTAFLITRYNHRLRGTGLHKIKPYIVGGR